MIPVNEPLLGEKEKEYLIKCIESGWIGSDGPFVKEFERRFSDYIGRRYGVAVSSGTAALEIAVKALGIGPGDEVIMPTSTIISCAQAVVKAGAKPVLVDCDYRTFNMIVEDIEEKVTQRTKAIMVVHIYGLPVDMDPVMEIAKENNLFIIEDCAEAIGLEYKGKKCGNFGDIAVFSFYPNKHITTGEGGMILTDNEEIAEKCRRYRNLCFSSNPDMRFIHEELGWNYRITNLQAAVGLAQLEKIEDHIRKKRWIGNLYQELLKDVEHIYLPVKETEYAENIYWVFPILIKDGYPQNAHQVMKKLKQLGIDTRPFFYPMHKQPVFQKMGLFIGESYPNSEKLYEKGFYIPSGLGITEEQILKVCESIKEVFK